MTEVQSNFTGPVTMHVHASVDAPERGASPAALIDGPTVMPAVMPTVALAAPEAPIRFDRNYAARRGYDPAFLGAGLPMPAPALAPAWREDALPGRAARRSCCATITSSW